MGKTTNLISCQQAMATRFNSLLQVFSNRQADKEAFLISVLELCLNQLAGFCHGSIILFEEIEGERKTIQYTLEPNTSAVQKKASSAATFRTNQ